MTSASVFTQPPITGHPAVAGAAVQVVGPLHEAGGPAPELDRLFRRRRAVASQELARKKSSVNADSCDRLSHSLGQGWIFKQTVQAWSPQNHSHYITQALLPCASLRWSAPTASATDLKPSRARQAASSSFTRRTSAGPLNASDVYSCTREAPARILR